MLLQKLDPPPHTTGGTQEVIAHNDMSSIQGNAIATFAALAMRMQPARATTKVDIVTMVMGATEDTIKVGLRGGSGQG